MKKNSQKWEKLRLKHIKKCKEIICLSDEIRYVGIVNQYGKTLAGTLKQGIKPLFSKSQTRDEFFAITSFIKLRANTMTSIGKMKYMLLNHQKANSLIFHDKKIIYYITFPNDVMPSNLLIKKITKIIMLG
jgi:hypothetical protein|tara:strand:- start:7 stop:399 length:393 start_codon:yes stop_codon:yes gene_type:complete